MDDRNRISIPSELLQALIDGDSDPKCILAKERPGAVSLWRSQDWSDRLSKDIALVKAKIEAGHLQDRTSEVQLLGRLLSTRHRDVELAGRGRLSIPEGFRGFLGVEPGGEVMVVGAAVCIEIWRPSAWVECLETDISQFGTLLDQLAS